MSGEGGEGEELLAGGGGLGEGGVSLGVWLGEAEEGGMEMPMARCRDEMETTSAGST